MINLISALLIAVAAQSAVAEQRDSKPFSTVNGRTTTSMPASPAVLRVNTASGGQSSPVTGAPIAGTSSFGGRSYPGGGRAAVAAREANGRTVRHGGKTISGGKWRKADDGGEEAPPNFSKPGALILTTGQPPKYEKAEEVRMHTVDAGEIVFNPRKAIDVARAPSLQQGPRDTPPPPNPDYYYGRAYTGGASINTARAAGGSGGHDNNGSGNNGRINGDDADGKGRNKGIDDPTGFNDAY